VILFWWAVSQNFWTLSTRCSSVLVSLAKQLDKISSSYAYANDSDAAHVTGRASNSRLVLLFTIAIQKSNTTEFVSPWSWSRISYGIKLGSAKDIRRCRLRGRDSLNALEAGDAMRSSGLWYLPLRQKMNYPIMHLQLISSSVVTKYIETSQQRCMDWKPRKSCLLCSYSLYTNTSPDSPRQQLTMTGVAGVEEIEDGLAVWLRPPRKHSTSLACIARVTWCL